MIVTLKLFATLTAHLARTGPGFGDASLGLLHLLFGLAQTRLGGYQRRPRLG